MGEACDIEMGAPLLVCGVNWIEVLETRRFGIPVLPRRVLG